MERTLAHPSLLLCTGVTSELGGSLPSSPQRSPPGMNGRTQLRASSGDPALLHALPPLAADRLLVGLDDQNAVPLGQEASLVGQPRPQDDRHRRQPGAAEQRGPLEDTIDIPQVDDPGNLDDQPDLACIVVPEPPPDEKIGIQKPIERLVPEACSEFLLPLAGWPDAHTADQTTEPRAQPLLGTQLEHLPQGRVDPLRQPVEPLLQDADCLA